MKPYYDHGGITIYHGDCREVLSDQYCQERWGDGLAIVTDPPYGTEAFNNGYGRKGHKIANDSDLSALDGMLRSLFAAPGMDAPLWLCAFCACRKRRTTEDVLMAHGLSLIGEAVWDKGRPSLGYTVRYAHESAIIARRGEVKPNQPLISVLRGKRTSEVMAQRHPHEKPVEVMARLISFATPTDGFVLDPFSGTGATLRAAKNLDRKAIGIELEERYCEIAAKRLEQEVLPL